MSKIRHAVCLTGIVLLVWLQGCSLPAMQPRQESTFLSLSEVEDTGLGRGILPLMESRDGLSGYYPLTDSLDAFAARMLMIYAAERSLDVQYYIWRRDLTGVLLLGALYDSAERGVRVRLLLDDHGTAGLDDLLTILNQHPNIEVRLFNPYPNRRFKYSRFLWDARLANRRMHNKSMIADNLVALGGGRNIGDEYFGATDGILFSDLDVLVVGPVVQETSADFDQFWQSPLSYPSEQLIDLDVADDALFVALMNKYQAPNNAYYLQAVINNELLARVVSGDLMLQWVDVDLVSDSPVKIKGHEQGDASLVAQLAEVLDKPTTSLDIVSPYFVPGKKGVDALVALQRRGVQVRVLTNARESTDVLAVHAGYSRYRKALLREGIELYEMRRHRQQDERDEKNQLWGSSGTSLHAKTFAIDQQRVFIGSFNFDPRSVFLNSEMGFVIHSPPLAEAISATFSDALPAVAYRVSLSDRGKLQWHLADGVVLDQEPGSNFWGNRLLNVLSILPIEGLL